MDSTLDATCATKHITAKSLISDSRPNDLHTKSSENALKSDHNMGLTYGH